MGPREIDLDILYYGDIVLEKEELHIPINICLKEILLLFP